MTTTVVANRIKKTIIGSLTLLLTGALVSSCGPTLTVSSDYDRSANFAAYKTFSMYSLKNDGSVSRLNEDRIVKYIRAEMEKKGFREDSKNPDLLVNTVTVMKNKKGITASAMHSYGWGGVYRPYGYWAAPVSGSANVTAYDYKDGSLVIDVIDASNNKMIWTGSGSAEIHRQPKNPEHAISETVTKIMSGFPAAPNK